MSPMNWARRLLSDSGDDTRFRSGLGLILATCMALLPPVSGRMDMPTFLAVALVGAVVVLPFWREIGEPRDNPRSIIAFLVTVIGVFAIARTFSALAISTYLGGWAFTLSLMRFLTGWRDPLGPAPDPELNPDGVSWPLVLVLVLPLLAIAGVAVWGVATEGGLLR
jgi:hypothetical protein